jgi:predicted F0F1-ATPase subunit
VAVDEGVLVKTGRTCWSPCAARSAERTSAKLREAVEKEFLTLDEREQSVRSVMAKMEADFCAAWRSFNMNDEAPKETLETPNRPSPAGRREGGAQAQGAAQPTQGVWFGLGMMGLIGWSVVVPTLLGAALGIWLDAHHPGKHIPGRWRCWSPGSRSAVSTPGIGSPRKTRRCGGQEDNDE